MRYSYLDFQSKDHPSDILVYLRAYLIAKIWNVKLEILV